MCAMCASQHQRAACAVPAGSATGWRAADRNCQCVVIVIILNHQPARRVPGTIFLTACQSRLFLTVWLCVSCWLACRAPRWSPGRALPPRAPRPRYVQQHSRGSCAHVVVAAAGGTALVRQAMMKYDVGDAVRCFITRAAAGRHGLLPQQHHGVYTACLRALRAAEAPPCGRHDLLYLHDPWHLVCIRATAVIMYGTRRLPCGGAACALRRQAMSRYQELAPCTVCMIPARC